MGAKVFWSKPDKPLPLKETKKDKKMNQICNNCRYQQITKPDGATVPDKVTYQKGIIGDETAYAKFLVGNKPLKCEFWEPRDESLEIDWQ